MNPAAPLPLLSVAPSYFAWRNHRVATYSAGSGRPLLLVHSINAAASVFEMRGPFNDLRDSFAVHAIDLLGYGNSDRPAHIYRADDYVELLGAQLARIGKPTALVASSLGAAYAIAAASRWPERVSALVLVCPVGIEQLARPAGPVAYGIYRVLRGPVGRFVFQRLTSRAGLRYFLGKQAYYDPASVTPATLDGYYATSHRPGAHYAPICFLTGLLNCNIAADFATLRQPTLLVWGAQATTTPPSQAASFQAANPAAQLAIVDSASLSVQDEQPQEFNQLVRAFLQ